MTGSTTQPIRSFSFHASDADLDDLRRRVAATKWPGKETVPDSSEGVQLAVIQQLARYWAEEYDWRQVEARINALPNFITEIDGVDIHFLHVRSRHENAIPMIVTHGWPGSVIEQMKIVGPLTDPTAHGGTAEDAFHLVIPSMPGYGFSGHPTQPGWEPTRIARAWAELMQRLGYERYVAQGGDWGAVVTEQLAVLAPPEPARGPHEHAGDRARTTYSPGDRMAANAEPPAGLSAPRRQHAYERSSPTSSSTASATRRRWRTARKRSTRSRTRRSGWPPGCMDHDAEAATS
jgi:pimeloyl-ACP methyl ester carboxylesterase